MSNFNEGFPIFDENESIVEQEDNAFEDFFEGSFYDTGIEDGVKDGFDDDDLPEIPDLED